MAAQTLTMPQPPNSLCNSVFCSLPTNNNKKLSTTKKIEYILEGKKPSLQLTMCFFFLSVGKKWNQNKNKAVWDAI